jgi:hypothetical protein
VVCDLIILCFGSFVFACYRIYIIIPCSSFFLFLFSSPLRRLCVLVVRDFSSNVLRLELTQAPESQKKENKAVHFRVICDVCGINPIIGDRYKCSVREDYDLCSVSPPFCCVQSDFYHALCIV